MNRIVLGAVMTFGLLIGVQNTSFAAGDGLDRNAAATGNSTFAGQHREARSGAAMLAPRMGNRRMMRHKHHRRHR